MTFTKEFADKAAAYTRAMEKVAATPWASCPTQKTVTVSYEGRDYRVHLLLKNGEWKGVKVGRVVRPRRFRNYKIINTLVALALAELAE